LEIKESRMKKFRKSTLTGIAFLIYVSAMGAYFLPHNHEVSTGGKLLLMGAAYLIVVALWLVLRKKETMQHRRQEKEGGNPPTK
jgi:hypothetical protein